MRRTKALYMFAFMSREGHSPAGNSLPPRPAGGNSCAKVMEPPVHIPLLAPFFIPIERTAMFESRMDLLKEWADGQSSFPVEPINFIAAENMASPYYIEGMMNGQIHDFRTGFLRQITKHFGFEIPRRSYRGLAPFGHREIGPGGFPWLKAGNSGGHYKDNFNCEAFHLWKHDGCNWQVVREFNLNGLCEQLPLFAA